MAFPYGLFDGDPYGDEALHRLWPEIPATTTNTRPAILLAARMPTRTPSTLATGETARRPRLPRQRHAFQQRMGSGKSRLLEAVSTRQPRIRRSQSKSTARAKSATARGHDCKRGCVTTTDTSAIREISPDSPQIGRASCWESGVDKGGGRLI